MKFGESIKKRIPGFIRKPIERLQDKLAWSKAQWFMAFLGLCAALIMICGLIQMIPRSLSSFFPWEKMEDSRIFVYHGRWEWSVSTDSNYKNMNAEFSEGTAEYERLVDLLETTHCSGFVQSLFPRKSYSLNGSQENIRLSVAWEKNGQWQWTDISIYDNGTLLVNTGNGFRIFYMDWFGSNDCERFFEEVKELLKQSSEKNEA